jgi:hypothetical protein
MVIVSLDSPSCEVTLFGPVYRWFIGTLPDRPRDYTVWSTLEPSEVDLLTWAGIIQVGSATAVAHAGEREGKESWAGPRVWVVFSPSSFPFLFYTQTFKHNYLNSNKFEFKPNTNTTMHQHECTSKLTLWLILFSCVINCFKCHKN